MNITLSYKTSFLLILIDSYTLKNATVLCQAPLKKKCKWFLQWL